MGAMGLELAIPLGPFLLHQAIGWGGMGEVWRGVHAEQGVPVAVKLLPAGADEEYRATLRNEVRAIAALSHPRIIGVYDFGEVPAATAEHSLGLLPEGAPWLAMEYADGGSLADRGQLGWSELRETLIGLLDALSHAHARGVIHRDLKPSNVLYAGSPPELKLSDFGMAHAEGDEPSGLRGGTPAYMAPEQFQGRWRDYGPWTDLYALGCVAYSLAAGRPPYGRQRYRRAREAHLTRPVPALTARVPVPDGFEAWVHRLLQKAPMDRYQRAADAAWALVRLGDAPEPDTAVARPRVRTESITQLWSEEAPPEPAPAAPAAPRDRAADVPPMPASWRRPREARRTRLANAGLGIVRFRPVPLVGREAERDQLWKALLHVRHSGRSRAVVVGGPAGFGKTRLADWLARRAHELGAAQVLKGSHSPFGGPADGLGSMVCRFLRCVDLPRAAQLDRTEVLLRALGVTDPWEWRALAWLMRPVTSAELRGGRVRPVRFRSARERHQLLLRFLARVAAERPVVLWLDDAQWSTDTLAFVEALLRHLTPVPILALLTVRDDALAERPTAASALRRLEGLPRARRLDLGPLDEAERVRLIEELLHLEGELAARVDARAVGNPQLAAELVNDWVSRGLLEAGEYGYRLRPGATLDLPDSLYDVWERRLDRALVHRPPQDRVALELAAALGPRVVTAEWEEVCAMAGVQPSRGLLSALLEQRLVRAPRQPRLHGWSFAHAMLRESVERAAAEAGRREDHHRVCARMVAKRSAPDRLGRHLLAAGEAVDAVEALLRAARLRLAEGELREAEALLAEQELALAAAGLDPRDRWAAEGRVIRAQLALILGRPDEAAELADEVGDVSREHGWSELSAAAGSVRARLAQYEGYPREGAVALVELLAEVEESANERAVAEVRRDLGQLLTRSGEVAGAREHLEAALPVLERVGDSGDVGLASAALARVHRMAGDSARAAAWLSRAVDCFEAYGSRHLQALAKLEQGDAARVRGDLAAASRHYRQARDELAEVGARESVWAEVLLGVVAVREGRLAEARAAFADFLGSQVASSRRDLAAVARAWLLATVAGEWDFDAWDQHLPRLTRDLAESSLASCDVARGLELAALSALDAGEAERARDALQAAHDHWERLGRDTDMLRVQRYLSRLA